VEFHQEIVLLYVLRTRDIFQGMDKTRESILVMTVEGLWKSPLLILDLMNLQKSHHKEIKISLWSATSWS
jgi:hypothetical protein